MHKDKEYRRCAVEGCDAGVFEELEFRSRGDGLDRIQDNMVVSTVCDVIQVKR